MTKAESASLIGGKVFGSALISLLILVSSCSTKPKEPAEVYTRRSQADSLLLQGYNLADILKFDIALSSLDEALNIYASLDNREGMINALLAMGRTKRMSGDTDSAEGLYSHAQSLAGFSEDPRLLRSVLNHQADLAIRDGDPIKALDLLADRDPGVSEGRERSAQLRLRGAAKHAIGSDTEAVELLVEAAGVAEAADEAVAAAQAYYKLASIASLGARYTEAEEWALLALEADKSREYSLGIAADLRALAIISGKIGNNEASEDYYRRSWLAWRALGRTDDAELSLFELESLTGIPVTLP